MIEQANTQTGIFSSSRRAAAMIDRSNTLRSEWWLNVDYAETIDLSDKRVLEALRTRPAQES